MRHDEISQAALDGRVKPGHDVKEGAFWQSSQRKCAQICDPVFWVRNLSSRAGADLYLDGLTSEAYNSKHFQLVMSFSQLTARRFSGIISV